MREVLISIQPKWVEKICRGEKTVEVRKTRPKCEVPFKCYIYCTQGKSKDLGVIGNEIYQKRMKVIGEFVCDKIVQFENSLFDEALSETVARSCVPMYDLLVYLGKQDYGYGWHITDLVVYDEPKELSQVLNRKQAEKCANHCEHNGMCQYCKEIRPPQSWYYLEVRE